MSFREQIAQRNQLRNADENSVPAGELEYVETFESSPFFGVDNARNAPPCVEFRLKNNSFKAIPYSFILEVNFDPSEGIEIMTTTKMITIKGRNLSLLFKYMAAFRVRFIQANIGNDLTEEKVLFVSDIKFDEV